MIRRCGAWITNNSPPAAFSIRSRGSVGDRSWDPLPIGAAFPSSSSSSSPSSPSYQITCLVGAAGAVQHIMSMSPVRSTFLPHYPDLVSRDTSSQLCIVSQDHG